MKYYHNPTVTAFIIFTVLSSARVSGGLTLAAESPGGKSLGCYKDPYQSLLAPYWLSNTHRQTFATQGANVTESCLTYCDGLGTQFAAVSNGTNCTCGVQYFQLDKAGSETDCNINCSVDMNCGGKTFANLYQIDYTPCILNNSHEYVTFKDSCYRYESDKTLILNWTAAQAKCKAELGNLVSIHSSQVNNFVLSLPYAQGGEKHATIVWSGGIDTPNGQGFEWSDGTYLDYTDWRPGQPSIHSLDEVCMTMSSRYPTPYHGTWSDASCELSTNYVCERVINAPKYAPPADIVLADVGASVGCVRNNTAEWLNDTTTLALYPLNEEDADGSTIRGRGYYGTKATYVQFSADGTKKKDQIPKFVINHDKHGESMKFDGTVQLVSNETFPRNGSTMTVAAWVHCDHLGPSPPLEMIIASQSYINESATVVDWSLTIELGKEYCFNIQAMKLCTTDSSVLQGESQHVTGRYYGSYATILVDGRHAASNGWGPYHGEVNADIDFAGLGDDAYTSDYAFVIGGEYQLDSITSNPKNNFRGLLDEVRVYNKSLQHADALFLFVCTETFQDSTIFIYEGHKTQMRLVGHGFNRQQRVGLSIESCENSIIDTKHLAPMFTIPLLGGLDVIIDFPAAQVRNPSTFYPETDAEAYQLCITTPYSPDRYMRALGIDVVVTRVDSIGGRSDYMDINIDSGVYVDWNVTIGGYGLKDDQVITISEWPDCSRPVASTTVRQTRADHKNATISLQFSAAVDLYHLCWKAKGTVTYDGIRVGLDIILTGASFKTRSIASNDGSFTIITSDIKKGTVDPKNPLNFFKNCSRLDNFGTYFLEVTIGEYSDYLIPMKGASACQVLMGAKKNHPVTYHYFYSAVSPISDTFDGDVEPVPTSFFNNMIGGSILGFPKDGRDQLNVWGTMQYASYNDNFRGGCCQLKATQRSSWDLPYKITAYKFTITKSYFRVITAPKIVFTGEKFGITVMLGDLYGEPDLAQCSLGVKVNNGVIKRVRVYPCRHTFTISTNGTNSTIELYLNDVMKKSIAVDIQPLPEYFSPLSINEKVPGVLGLLLNKSSSAPMWPSFLNVSMVNPYFNFFDIPDPLIKPFDGQKDSVRIPDGKGSTLDGVWTSIDLESVGVYGSGVPVPKTVQFFTFALYSASMQTVRYNITCVDRCFVFIDGKYVHPYRPSTLKEGNHQVVVQLFTYATVGKETGFNFSYSQGDSIAFSPAMPFNAPPSTTTLTKGIDITEFISTISGFKGPFDFNYLGGDKDDSTVLPSLEDSRFTVVSGKSFPIRKIASSTSITNYFAIALYSTNFGRISFNMPVVGGKMEVWVDGVIVYRTVGAVPGGDVMGFHVRRGWHQLLIKAHVSDEEPNWSFALIVENVISTVVYAALELPESLPEGATDMTKHPIIRMLQAQTPMYQYEVPYDYTLTNNSAANDPSFSDVPVDVKPQMFKNVPIKGNKTYSWQAYYASSSSAGVFGPRMPDAGAYNQYFAFALYLSRPTYYITLSILHYSGVGMWMNGKQVLGNVNHSIPSGEIVNITDVDMGWNQFLVRLQEPLNMKLFSVPNASKARPLCASKGFNLCTRDRDICPFGDPKPGSGWPLEGDKYAVIDGSNANGIGIGNENLCNVTNSFPPGAELFAACCGTSLMLTNFSIELMDIKGDALIGWATSIPQPPIPEPNFNLVESDGYTIVEIFPGEGTPTGAVLKYMIGVRTEVVNYTIYTKPLNITVAAHITAVAEYDNKMSAASEILVTDIHHFQFSRDMCPSMIPCVIQVTNGANTAEGSFAVLVAADEHDLIIKILNSSSFVQRTSTIATRYTNLMLIGSAGFIVTPAIGSGPNYWQKFLVKMVVFPPGANREDMRGILVNGDVTVFPLNIRSITQNNKTVPAIPYSPLALSGGFVGGDILSFPQLQSNINYKTCNWRICMQSMLMDSSDLHIIMLTNGEALPLNLSGFRGTLECVCMAAVGGSFVDPMRILRKHYYPIPQSLHINVDKPQNTSKHAQLLSFGPPTVGPSGSLSLVGYLPNDDVINVIFQCAKDIVFRCSNTNPTFNLTKRTNLDSQGMLQSDGDNDLQMLIGIVNFPADKPVYGVWRLAIKLGDIVLTVTGDPPPTVSIIDNPPQVTYADGLCARDSTKCIDGTEVIFIGNGFNYEDLMHNSVILMDPKTNLRSRSVSCIPTAVSATNLTCKLEVISEGPKEPIMLRVVMATLVAPIHQKFIDASFPKAEKDTGNSLLLNQDGPGWSGNILPPTPSPTPKPSPTPLKSSLLAYIIAGVVGGILVIVLLIGGFVCVRYDFVRKPDDDEAMLDIADDVNGDPNAQYLRLNDGDVNDLPPATRAYVTHI